MFIYVAPFLNCSEKHHTAQTVDLFLLTLIRKGCPKLLWWQWWTS